MKGDRILSINGQNVSRWDDLRQMIEHRGGRDVLLSIKRGTETLS